MALPSSGTISLMMLGLEYNDSTPHSMSEFYNKPGGPTSGTISLSDFYGLSNSQPAGEAFYTTAGSYSWTCPTGITEVYVLCVGGGAQGLNVGNPRVGGGGGGLGYKNGISVTPGNSYTVVVGGVGGDSYFINTSTVKGGGGDSPGGGSYTGDGGGNGGNGGSGTYAGGGGAGGYSGNGGNGANGNTSGANLGGNGSGGAGGGGSGWWSGGGGGVGAYGEGTYGTGGNGSSSQYNNGGGGGSGGQRGAPHNDSQAQSGQSTTGGGSYGGGGNATNNRAGTSGCVRILYGGASTTAWPSTNVGSTRS